jgi:SAM-dependent methyltransferase
VSRGPDEPSRGSFDGKTYQARFDALARSGVDVHGEATMVRSYEPATVLDAGCGTGRVAIELASHGIDVVGVDVDPSMITEARRLAPQLAFLEVDLSELALGRHFDVVVLAGNVPLFCPPLRRRELIVRCAEHVGFDGVLLTGFQLGRGYGLAELDEAVGSVGLVLEDRWSSWERATFDDDSDYAVSVLRSAR